MCDERRAKGEARAGVNSSPVIQSWKWQQFFNRKERACVVVLVAAFATMWHYLSMCAEWRLLNASSSLSMDFV